MDRSPAESTGLLDRTAIALSGLCVLHCLSMPFVLVLLPLLGQFTEEHFHLQMLAIVAPASTIALGLGYRRHRHPGIPAGGVIGLLLLLVGATWAHSEIGIVADRVITIAGSSILAVAHFYNSRLHKYYRLSEQCK